MSTERTPRVIKAADRFEQMSQNNVARDENCATIRLEDLRAYLIERRRAVMTELQALNHLLKIE